MSAAEETHALAYRVSNVHEVAPWGRSTTFRLVREGRLPTRRLGNITFVLHQDLMAFLEGLATSTPAATADCLSSPN